MEVTKYARHLGTLFDMIRRRGVAWLVWDHGHVSPKPIARLSVVEDRPIIGTYTIGADVRDVLADIEAMQAELGVRARPPRPPYKPRRANL